MYTRLFLVAALLLSRPVVAGETLSREARVSLLTCAPGDQLYSLFGHTALRVRDPGTGLDAVFNYGTFDFSTPGFYFKFARGTLLYQLSRTTFSRFMAEYHSDQRGVQEQTLRLDSLQRQRLWELLETNYLPENRSYRYNFLYDNCTTRARDLINAVLHERVRRGAAEFGKSFWDLLDEYLEVAPWTRWGIHAILGAPAMKRATRWEQMFLPDYLARGVDSTRVNGEPLVETARTLVENRGRGGETPWYLTPFVVFAACAAGLFLLLRRSRRRWLFFSAAIPFFVATGILGCLMVFLGFTEHPATAPNANLLWANPLNLFAAAFIARRRLSKLIMIHLWLYLAMLFMALFAWAFFVPSVLYSSLVIILWMGYLTIRVAAGRLPGV